MAIHNIRILEPDPHRRGFLRHIYALVEVTRHGEDWIWRQVDRDGHHLTVAGKAFRSEDAALSDAVKSLGGVGVGVNL